MQRLSPAWSRHFQDHFKQPAPLVQTSMVFKMHLDSSVKGPSPTGSQSSAQNPLTAKSDMKKFKGFPPASAFLKSLPSLVQIFLKTNPGSCKGSLIVTGTRHAWRIHQLGQDGRFCWGGAGERGASEELDKNVSDDKGRL